MMTQPTGQRSNETNDNVGLSNLFNLGNAASGPVNPEENDQVRQALMDSLLRKPREEDKPYAQLRYALTLADWALRSSCREGLDGAISELNEAIRLGEHKIIPAHMAVVTDTKNQVIQLQRKIEIAMRKAELAQTDKEKKEARKQHPINPQDINEESAEITRLEKELNQLRERINQRNASTRRSETRPSRRNHRPFHYPDENPDEADDDDISEPPEDLSASSVKNTRSEPRKPACQLSLCQALNTIPVFEDGDQDLQPFEKRAYRRQADKEALEQFMFGLNGELQHQVRTRNPFTLQEAIYEATDFEQKKAARRCTPDTPRHADSHVTSELTDICNFCRVRGHHEEDCRAKNATPKTCQYYQQRYETLSKRRMPYTIQCEYCHRKGHTLSGCRNLETAIRTGQVIYKKHLTKARRRNYKKHSNKRYKSVKNPHRDKCRIPQIVRFKSKAEKEKIKSSNSQPKDSLFSWRTQGQDSVESNNLWYKPESASTLHSQYL